MRRKLFVNSVVPVLVTPPPWSPLNLGASLIDFWDASAGVVLSGADVITWTGQGPNHYVLGLNAITGAAAPVSPTYNAASFNGKPGITFAGANGVDGQYLTTTANAVSFGTNTPSFFMACTLSNGVNGFGRWLSTDNNATDWTNPDSIVALTRDSGTDSVTWTYNFNVGATTLVTVGYDTPFRYGVIFDGVNGTIYLNNVQQTPNAIVLTLAATLRLAVGTGYNANHNVNGIARRIVITNNAVSATDRANIDTWLQG
jgi:hypothetical protein